jgi:transcriptional regulator with XRE-family HTH domain
MQSRSQTSSYLSDPTKAEFSRRLEAYRLQKGWNHSELARRATTHLPKPAVGQKRHHQIGRDLIGQYVRGKILPNPVYLEALAKALSVNTSDLLPNGSARGHQPTGDQPAFAMEAVDEGRVAFRLNRTLSLTTALKIANILAEEDRT